MDRRMEASHLLLADRHIAEGEARIAGQEALLARFRIEGRDTGPAEELLRLMDQTLVCWREHRAMIAASLAEPNEGGVRGD